MCESRFELGFDKETQQFSLHDRVQQCFIVVEKEQLEILISEYCKQYNYIIM
jgi:hypothetical protein